jgi:hypothetical protein
MGGCVVHAKEGDIQSSAKDEQCRVKSDGDENGASRLAPVWL